MVKEKTGAADFSVHLLDKFPGREISGSDNSWYPQKQAEIGMEFARSQLIWLPSETDISTVEEEEYRLFLQSLEEGRTASVNYEFVRGSKSTLTQQIIAQSEKIRQQEQVQPISKGNISVLLDTHYNDQAYAFDLSTILLKNAVQPFINPQEDDPRHNVTLLAERMRQVNKMVFFYGKVSKEWVMERMSAALQLIVTNDYPIEDFFIFMVPPAKDSNAITLKQRFLKINVINTSHSTTLDTGVIKQFLTSLKGPLDHHLVVVRG